MCVSHTMPARIRSRPSSTSGLFTRTPLLTVSRLAVSMRGSHGAVAAPADAGAGTGQEDFTLSQLLRLGARGLALLADDLDRWGVGGTTPAPADPAASPPGNTGGQAGGGSVALSTSPSSSTFNSPGSSQIACADSEETCAAPTPTASRSIDLLQPAPSTAQGIACKLSLKRHMPAEQEAPARRCKFENNSLRSQESQQYDEDSWPPLPTFTVASKGTSR